jgi:RNA polymerase primary sigma factor
MEKSGNSLEIYLREINNYPLLSREKENDYVIKAKNGDKLAREKLIESNLRFVVSVAKFYRRRGLDMEDLINEGNIGLMNSIKRYDPGAGFHFLTYAVWWIRQSITKALCEKQRNIRLPLNKLHNLNHIKKEIDYLSPSKNIGEVSRNNRTIEQIATNLGLEKSIVLELINLEEDTLSLEYPFNKENSFSLGDSLEDNLSPSPENQTVYNIVQEDIQKVLKEYLTPREKKIIEKRFGLNGEFAKSLNEIGLEYNLNKERIRQIEEKALRKLRGKDIKEKLASYFYS